MKNFADTKKVRTFAMCKRKKSTQSNLNLTIKILRL